MTAAVLLALAASAAAQSPMPISPGGPEYAQSPAPAVSTATQPAVAPSTAAASEAESSHAGVKVGGGEPKAKLSRPLHAFVHADSKDWEPLSLRVAGDPLQAENAARLRETKVKGKYKGPVFLATANARIHKTREDVWLVISIFPKKATRRRLHFEIRFRMVEGYVEAAQAALVTIVDQRPKAGMGLNSYELRAQGVEFEEDSPGSGRIEVAALDHHPGKSAFNAGALKLAPFADKEVGTADVSWSVTGLPAPR